MGRCCSTYRSPQITHLYRQWFRWYKLFKTWVLGGKFYWNTKLIVIQFVVQYKTALPNSVLLAGLRSAVCTMPGTHYAFLDSDRRHSAFAVASHGKVECRAGKSRNLPGGLFEHHTINFSVFTQVVISLSAIYYKCPSYYMIFAFLCMKYEVDLKDFCNYFWLFASKAESLVSRVCFQCGRPWDYPVLS